jgi:hypothetical protein
MIGSTSRPFTRLNARARFLFPSFRVRCPRRYLGRLFGNVRRRDYLATKMTSDATETTKRTGLGWGALLRFLPYLWPKDEPKLKARVVFAVLLVLVAKAATLTMPFLYKAVVDRMASGLDATAGLIMALVIAYAGARFGSVLFDNLRNAIFERVG